MDQARVVLLPEDPLDVRRRQVPARVLPRLRVLRLGRVVGLLPDVPLPLTDDVPDVVLHAARRLLDVALLLLLVLRGLLSVLVSLRLPARRVRTLGVLVLLLVLPCRRLGPHLRRRIARVGTGRERLLWIGRQRLARHRVNPARDR